MEIDKRQKWLYCKKCGEMQQMAVEGKYYDEDSYRLECRCTKCGQEVLIYIEWFEPHE